MKYCPQCQTGFPDNATTCAAHGVLLSEIRDLRPGMLIRKTYRIVRLLGKGGMGSVYLAQHELMDAPRALKFLSSDLTADEAFTRRFLREGRMLRQIRHKNVVDCGDLERAEDESLFFAMEFVDGPDLRGLLTASGPLEAPVALGIAREIAEGLGAAHALGMVHRDIKPENVLMARAGAVSERRGWTPKIADFGIVATVETSTIYKSTRGSLLTPPYAAPEQWRGTRASELDGRTDLYALGGVLFEMLTGQTVFDAENYEGWLFQHLETSPRLPSSVRPELAGWTGLDALVLRLLAKDREKRPRDVAELLNLLDAVRPPAAQPRRPTVVERTPTLPEPAPSRSPVLTPNPDLTPPAASQRELPSRPETEVIQSTEPKREKAAAKKGLKMRWEFLLFLIVGMVFFISWWENRQKEDQIAADQAVQNALTGTAQPAAGTGNAGQGPLTQQAKAMTDQGHFKAAIPLLDQACTAGDAQACSDLGGLYVWGPHFTEADTVTQNFPRALKLLGKACEAGNASGCGKLGLMYDQGQGVTTDLAKAAVFYARACDGNYAEACNNLGVATQNGAGVAVDKDKARQLWKKGCDLGSEAACDWLKQTP